MLDLGLQGKVALITGASDGLGRAAAARLAAEGALVAICARRGPHLEAAAAALRAETGGEVLAVSADVTRADDCRRFVDEAARAFGGVDILLNNAGTSAARGLEEVGDADWQADIDLKLMAAVRLCRAVIPIMRARGGGAIVNTTIVGGKAPAARGLPTSVTRAAGINLTKSLANEYARDNIRVNTIYPGDRRSQGASGMRTSRLLMPLGGVLAGLVLATGAATSAEVEYPHDTVTLVTHSSPGGGTDVFLREMIKHLGPIMGVDFVVENASGGSGAKAMALLATSPPDGTIFYGTTPTFINTSILSDVEYTYQDLEPLVNVFLDPQIVYTGADSPFDSLADVIEAAKQNPGQQKWGVSTPGSLDRQVMEQLKAETGVEVIIVTHEGGGDLLINVLNGTLDVGVGEIQELIGQIEAGEVKLLASYTEERLETHPDLMTAREQGIDLVVDKFRGLAGPKGLPADVIAAWEQAIPLLLEVPEFKEYYQEGALVPAFMPHDEYGSFIARFAEDQKKFMAEYGITED